MKKKIKYVFLMLCFCLFYRDGTAQNLVPNPSFEQYISCPITIEDSTINYLSYWQPVYIYSVFGNTPDYYNICVPSSIYYNSVPINSFGNQMPRTGNGYAGLYVFGRGPIPFFEDSLPLGREYMEIRLKYKLKPQKKYYVEMYVSLADEAEYAISTMGVFFSDTALSSSRNYISRECQVQNNKSNLLSNKENWVLVADSFVAIGGEEYLTIGNFVHDSVCDSLNLNTGYINAVAYYYIDDVLVVDVDSLEFLTADIKTPREEMLTPKVQVFPNHIQEYVSIKVTNAQLNGVELFITDLLGRTIAKQTLLQELTSFSTQDWSNGMYVWSLVEDGRIVRCGKLVKE
jgi:hypothetical protein